MEEEDDLVPVETSERSDWLERVETQEKDRLEEVQESAGVG